MTSSWPHWTDELNDDPIHQELVGCRIVKVSKRSYPFKLGDTVECTQPKGTTLKLGVTYIISSILTRSNNQIRLRLSETNDWCEYDPNIFIKVVT